MKNKTNRKEVTAFDFSETTDEQLKLEIKNLTNLIATTGHSPSDIVLLAAMEDEQDGRKDIRNGKVS